MSKDTKATAQINSDDTAAKESKPNEKKLTPEEKLAKAAKRYEKKITTTFPYNGNPDDNEIHVTYNGVNYIIIRGEQVTIPYGVYELVMESERRKIELSHIQKKYNKSVE